MFPDVIRFKDLDIDPKDILQHRKLKNRPIPFDWTRHDFRIPSVKYYGGSVAPLVLIDDWIETNSMGRWTSYASSSYGDDTLVVVYFEFSTDAVFFKLAGGDTLWKEVT